MASLPPPIARIGDHHPADRRVPAGDYLRPRLFEPLGIEGARWDTDPHGVSLGGSGLHLTTEDIARLGQLYLAKGMWRGRQIVPEAWIADPPTHDELTATLAALSLPLPGGQPTSPHAGEWSGKSVDLERNDLNLEAIAIAFTDDRSMLTVGYGHGESSLPVGHGVWLMGSANLRGNGDEPVGGWTANDTFEVRFCTLEDVYCPGFLVHYTKDGLRLEVEVAPNVSWGVPTVTAIVGRRASRTDFG